MRNKLLSATLGLLFFSVGCSKPTHTSTTVHYQRYSSLNFLFDGITFNGSMADSATQIWTTNTITSYYNGDTMLPARELNITIYSSRYTMSLVGKKLDLGSVAGVYKIGSAYDGVNQYPINYGSGTITGFTNRENYYNTVSDSVVSYITVTSYDTHEIKGTFVLKCLDYSQFNLHTSTGDFDIIMP